MNFSCAVAWCVPFPSTRKQLLLAACWLTLLVSLSNAVVADRPNLVFIVVDDVGYGDLGCYGQDKIRTPCLDRLASEGTRFTDYYVQTVCGPSRSALLTGRHPVRSGGWGMPSSEIAFSELLKQAGYATCHIGKWDVSDRKPIPGRIPNDKGFDYFWGSLGANDLGGIQLWDNREPLELSNDMAGLSKTYTDRSIAWVEEHRRKSPEQPFLLYLCHTMMHVVIDASPEFKNRTGHGLYADAMEELDHEIGRIVDAIDALGEKENTLIVFFSDNGPWNNAQEKQHRKNGDKVAWSRGPEVAWGSSGPLRDGKATTYEGGIRVPGMVRMPGRVPASRVSQAIFSTVDWMPTLASIVGFPVPSDRHLDGLDQSDLLFGKNERGVRETLAYYHLTDLQAYRYRNWKYVLPKANQGAQLYDLANDLSESKDVATANPDIVALIEKLIEKERSHGLNPAIAETKAATKKFKPPARDTTQKKKTY
jgi:arylsulfatase A-like enzyme